MDKNKFKELLAAKATQLGLSDAELTEVAEALAGSANLPDDATDDAINAQIDAVLPFIGIGRQQAERLAKEQANTGASNPEPKTDEPKPTPNEPPPAAAKTMGDTKATLDALASQIGELTAQLNSFKSQQVTNDRFARLSKIVDPESAFGKNTLSNFVKMSFADDKEFEEYAKGITEVAQSIKQIEGGAKLSTLGNRPDTANRQNAASDAEVEAVVKLLS